MESDKQRTQDSLYCHFFIERNKGVIKTIKLSNLKDFQNIKISQLKEEIKTQLQQDKDKEDTLFSIKTINKTLYSRNLTDNLKVASFFGNKDDLFCEVEINVKPVKRVQEKRPEQSTDEFLKYKVLSTYSIYEASKQIVKVLITLKDVQDLPKENIKTFFSENSLEVKVIGLKNLNYSFGVPRLYKSIDPEKSEVRTEKDKLVIRLRKAKDDDHWSELYRVKGIGEKD